MASTTKIKWSAAKSNKTLSKNKLPPSSACSTYESISEVHTLSLASDTNRGLRKSTEIMENHCADQAPQVRQTITQVLREGARVKRKAEQAEKVFKDLCKGSQDPYKIQGMIEAIRQEENEALLCEIERKHLLGRISQEEARLAKLALVRNNQLRAAERKKQRDELELKLAEYRRNEEARLKELAEKSHASFELIKQAQANILDQKRKTAKDMQEESKKMQAIIDQRKQAELNHKINLIRQIKQLEQASKESFNKDTNSRSTINIGSSCTLNVEELKEALIALKRKIQEELNLRRQKIKQEKLRQQALIEDTRKIIERYKNVTKKTVKSLANKEVKQTPELIKLRKKLQQKKAEAARLEQAF